MDWQIRIALIISGILLVSYIIFDFNRKKKIKKENEKLKKRFSQLKDQVDGAGFDIDGVGKPRSTSVEKLSQETEPQEQLQENLQDQAEDELQISDGFLDKSFEEQKPQLPDYELPANPVHEPIEPVITDTSSDAAKATTPKNDLFESNSGSDSVVKEPELVLSLVLNADYGKTFTGKDFLPIFLSQGLRHGEMGIFHRYSKTGASPGKVLFSLANGIAPGTFDIDNIQNFQTPALALFVTLPGPDDAQIAYDAMYKTIKLLRNELGGDIFDETQSKYTEQTHNHRFDQIQEFNRKQS